MYISFMCMTLIELIPDVHVISKIVASNEVNVESKELELKEQLANISSRYQEFKI